MPRESWRPRAMSTRGSRPRRRSQRIHDVRDQPLERLGLANLAASGHLPRVIAAMAGALGVIRLEVLLCLHGAHGLDLRVHDSRDVDEQARCEVAKLRLMRLENK